MNIIIVSHLYPTPEDTVTGVFVHEQAKALRDRGHEITILSPTPAVPDIPYLPDRWARYRDTPQEANIEDIDVEYPRYVSLPSSHTLSLIAQSVRWTVKRRILKLVDSGEFSPDVINAHVPLPDGYACVPACHTLDVPLVTTVHGANVYQSSANPISRRMIQSVFEDSDALVFNSAILRSEAETRFSKVPASSIVHNGIPVADIESAPVADLSEYFSQERMVASSVGSLIERKGHSRVLQGIAKLEPAVRPNYLIMGDGPNRDELRRKVEGLGIEEYIHFTGYIPEHRDVFSNLKASDVMVLPSTDEAFGVAFIEAMACECVVIGCEGEGPSEFVEDGNTGFLILHDDTDAVADRLRFLAENRSEANQMGKAAREYVHQNLTWAENARQIEQIYRSIVSQPE